MIKVSDYIVKYFEDKNIQDAFILPGGGCLHLSVSLFESKINCISTHHEMACTIGAEAYSKIKNDVSVVFVTCGPGVTHAISGVAEAYIGATPLFVVSGQVKTNQTIEYNNISGLRQVGVQEINTIKLVKSITKYSAMVTDPNKILYHLDKAYYFAKENRQGPVWLDIPIDVQAAYVDENTLQGYEPEDTKPIQMNESVIQEVVKLFSEAKRPVILAGNGIRISNGIAALEEIIRSFHIPIVTSLQGIDILPTNHPNNMGNIGHKGLRSANMTIQKADLVLSVGSRLSTATTGYAYGLFADKAKKVVVDIDRIEHKKDTIKYDLFIHSDANQFLLTLFESLKNTNVGKFSQWLLECGEIKSKYAPLSEISKIEYDDGLDLYYVFDKITKNLSNDTTIVTDTGSALFVGMQNAYIKEGQRFISSGLASMGYSLPASTGISFANNKGKVIAFNGDGSFQQNVQELLTISKYQLPIKIVVLNNDGYFSMKETINRGYNAYLLYNSLKKNLSFPDYELLAKAHGIMYCRIEKAIDFEKDEYLSLMDSDLPVLINIITSNRIQIRCVTNYHNSDGTIKSSPLEDMYPFLDESVLKDIMGTHHHPRT